MGIAKKILILSSFLLLLACGVVTAGAQESAPDASAPPAPHGTWFDLNRANIAIVIAVFFMLVLVFIRQAGKGKTFFIR